MATKSQWQQKFQWQLKAQFLLKAQIAKNLSLAGLASNVIWACFDLDNMFKIENCSAV